MMPVVLSLILSLSSYVSSTTTWAKNQSSITIAFVGPYGALPGLEYDMNLVTGGYDRMNIEFLSDPKEYGPWQSFYWIQRAGQIMVDAINLTPTILPNTTIKIKRFDTFSPWTGLYSGGSVIGTAMDIAENHKDVVAVFGEFYAEFSIYSAQVYSMFQLPFCGPYQNSYSLLDRHKYPYYFQAKSISGQGNAVASLLSSWNVTRVAVIAEGLFNRKSSICAQYMESFQDMKIEIVAVITGASIYTIEETYRTLKSVDARYILICAGPSKTADIYYSLTITKKMQSSEYVWLSHNPLIPRSLSRAIKLWGPGYYRASQGIIMAQPFNPPTPKMTNLLAVYMQTLNDIQSPWTKNVFSYTEAMTMGQFPGFDCVGILALGLHQLLAGNSNLTPSDLESGKLQGYMNWTLFQKTNFTGLQSDTSELTKDGDLSSGYLLGHLLGRSDGNSMTWFALNPLGSSEILYYKNRTPVFAYNNTIPPPDGPVKEIIQIKMDSLQGRALIGFAISGLALTLVASVVITISRNKAAVRRASATFLMLCTIGYLLSYATNLLYFDTPTVLKCKMRVWFYAGSFSIVTSSLISKNSRICLIYGSRKLLKKFLVKDWLWIGFFSLLVFGEMIVLELWSKYANIRIVSRSTAYSLEYMCEMKSKWEFVIILYNLLLLFGLFAVTYASRNIQQTHSEFTLLLLISILASFGGIVIFAMTGSEVFNISFTVWIITTVPLLTQFAPIILQLYMSFKYREWIEKLESGSARKVVDAPSAIERRKTMKTLRPLSMGKFATSYPAAISIRNRFGFDSEWLRGQLYVGTISGNNEKKEMYFLFEQADFQRPLAFRPKRRDGIIIIARTLEANGHEQIILDTYQGFLVIDFLKENVLSDFENGIKTG